MILWDHTHDTNETRGAARGLQAAGAAPVLTTAACEQIRNLILGILPYSPPDGEDIADAGERHLRQCEAVQRYEERLRAAAL